jgi:TetR/AcrR family transcriptional regulator, lmrAB and yxaGH operons repressor
MPRARSASTRSGRPRARPAPAPTPDRPTRDRLVTAAAEQFRHGGYHASGIKAILRAAEAPYGSLYHFFPGGKEELGAAAIEASGAMYRELVEAYFPAAPGPGSLGSDSGDAGAIAVVEATRRFFGDAAEVLASTDWIDGCPVATVAAEMANQSDRLRRAANAAFESWLAVLTERLVALGVDPVAARAVAVQLFCLIEGALVLSRSARDPEALAVTGEAAAGIVARAFESSGPGPRPPAPGKKIGPSI